MNPLRDKIQALESTISDLEAAPETNPDEVIADIKLFCADCPLKDSMDCLGCTLYEWYTH